MATVIVVAGTCGTGKSTVGKLLEEHYKTSYLEGDDVHPQANIDKMANNIPLTDDDRWGWLKQISEQSTQLALQNPNKISVVSCSSLRKKYRDFIQAQSPDTQFRYVFLYNDYDALIKRMQARQNHYMKASMVQSQFDALELPEEDEKRERAYVIDVTHKPVDEVVKLSISWIDTQLPK